MAVVLLELPGDDRGAGVEVDVAPPQPGGFAAPQHGGFAAPQPAQRDQMVGSVQPVALDGVEERGGLARVFTRRRAGGSGALPLADPLRGPYHGFGPPRCGQLGAGGGVGALIAAPGQDIRALDLAAGGAGLAAAGAGPVLDTAARDAYRRRLGAVTAALEAADRAGDQETAERAEAERQALLRELRGSTGLPEPPHTCGASVRTGGSCRYDPAPGGPDRWLV